MSGMQIALRQEQFGGAYLKAITSVAGYSLTASSVDDDSIDWTIVARGQFREYYSPKIDIQLKCPYRFKNYPDRIVYPIPRKNYDDLRAAKVSVPRLLVVVTIPKALDDWVEFQDEGLILRYHAYWKSLLDTPDLTHQQTVSISIPKTQRLTVESLKYLMERAGAGLKQ